MGRLAILGFGGALPGRIAAEDPAALFVRFGADSAPAPAGRQVVEASYERWGGLFRALREHQVTDVVMAGSLTRPKLDPARFDARTLALAPKIAIALQQGDDALLRTVIGVFEAEGFRVRGAHEVVPGLTVAPGVVHGGPPSADDRADMVRGLAILAALGPLDVGQAVVVAGGQCLGIETVQGTDALLRLVAATPERVRGVGGVLVKAPKPGQDLRVDMPAIGPDTVAAAAAAGLAGIVIAADRVLLLDREATLDSLRAAGLFLEAVAV